MQEEDDDDHDDEEEEEKKKKKEEEEDGDARTVDDRPLWLGGSSGAIQVSPKQRGVGVEGAHTHIKLARQWEGERKGRE